METSGDDRVKRDAKSSDESRRKNREKVARWRKRNPAKMVEHLEELRRATIERKGLRKPTGYIVYDVVSADGVVTGAHIRWYSEPPKENEKLSDYLPHSPVDWPVASALRKARLQQLEDWCKAS
jgi:hypothetical protein